MNSVWLICGVGDLGHLLIVSGAIQVPGTFDHTLPKGATRRGSLEPTEMQNVLNWVQGGFSADASVRVEGWSRAGLERPLHYCARPPLSLKRLERRDEQHVIYRLPKPQRDGCTELSLTSPPLPRGRACCRTVWYHGT